jgi:hypothetical protein
MQLDWHDLKTNGCPALLRALKQIETVLTEQTQLLSVAEKQAKLILAAQTQQETRLSQAEKAIEICTAANMRQEMDIAEQQYLLSEELIARLAPPVELREIVEDLGAGWRIERQPTSPSASAATSTPPAANPVATTTIEDVDRQRAGVGRVLGAFQRTFVHSPGYPQNDEA